MADNSDINVELGLTINKFLAQLAKADAAQKRKLTAMQKLLDRNAGITDAKMAKGPKAAADSAKLLAAELDRLEARFNPAAAAARKTEAEIKDLDRAFKMGVVNTKQYNEQLARIRAGEAAGQLRGLQRNVQAVEKSMKRANFGSFRQTSMQLSQVAQQGAITGDYMKALAWQLPDLALVFGPVGIAVGALAGVFGTLAIDILRGTDSTKEFEDRLSELESALGAASAALDEMANSSMADLIRKYGEAGEEIDQLLKRLAAIGNRDAEIALKATVGDLDNESILEEVRKLGAGGGELPVALTYSNEEIEELQARLQNVLWARKFEVQIGGDTTTLDEQIKILEAELKDAMAFAGEQDPAIAGMLATAQEYRDLWSEIAELSKLEDMGVEEAEQLNAAAAGLLTILEEAGVRLDQGIGAELVRVDDLTRQFIKNLKVANGEITEADIVAAELTDEIGEAAVEALRLAGVDLSAGISDAAKEAAVLAANIGMAYSMALLLNEAGREAPPGNPRRQAAAAIIEESITAEEKRAAAIKQVNDLIAQGYLTQEQGEKRIQQLRAEGQTTARSGGGRASTPERDSDELKEARSLYDETRTSAERYKLELERLAEIEDTLTDAQKKSVDWTETKRRAMENLADEYEATRQAAQFFEQEIGNAFIDAITGAKSLEQAFADLAAQIAQAALQAAFFGQGPFSGLWGGSGDGIMGGLSDALGFSKGGYTGSGGKMEPAGVVHRGEYVFSKEATSRIGVKNLEALHKSGMPGFAGGGLVGRPDGGSVGKMLMPAASAPNVVVNPPNVKAVIVDDYRSIGAMWAQTPQGERDIMAVVERNRGAV